MLTLPTFQQADEACAAGRGTPIDHFICDHEPDGPAEVVFRTQLLHALQFAVREAKKEAAHWKAHHANLVRKCALLSQRPDLPVDRLPAFKEFEQQIDALNAQLRAANLQLQKGNQACQTSPSH